MDSLATTQSSYNPNDPHDFDIQNEHRIIRDKEVKLRAEYERARRILRPCHYLLASETSSEEAKLCARQCLALAKSDLALIHSDYRGLLAEIMMLADRATTALGAGSTSQLLETYLADTFQLLEELGIPFDCEFDAMRESGATPEEIAHLRASAADQGYIEGDEDDEDEGGDDTVLSPNALDTGDLEEDEDSSDDEDDEMDESED